MEEIIDVIDVLEIPEEMESSLKQWKSKLEEAKKQIDETLSEEEMKELVKSLKTKEDDIRSIRHAYEDYLNEKRHCTMKNKKRISRKML